MNNDTQVHYSIRVLDLQDKESIVNLLLAVQGGQVSCRRGATEIQKQIPKKHLSDEDRDTVRMMRSQGASTKEIAVLFGIHTVTVWRICKQGEGK